MADDAPQEEVGVEEWTEPVDITTLGDDGPTTIFVGGYSSLKTAKDGLEQMIYRDDRLVFLSGKYEGDLSLDSTYFNGVQVSGDGEVSFEGKLVVGYTSYDPDRVLKVPQAAEGEESAPPPAADAGEDAAPPAEEEAEEDGEGAAKKVVERPPRLTIQNMTFLSGLVTEGLTTGYVDDCVFGAPTGLPALEYCATIAPFCSADFTRCTFYGSGKAIVYAFPRAQSAFVECTFEGSVPPVTTTETIRRRRGYVPPSPPPPTAPTTTQCEVGLYLDDATVSVLKSSVSLVGIGLLCNDVCKGTTIEESLITLTSTTGVLLLDGASPKIARTRVNLNGRESLVVGNNAHPNIRNCAFAGDVRLKTNAIHTGLTDNLVGPNKQVTIEGTSFVTKGFTVVAVDPTYVKPKKVVVEEEEG